MKKYTKPEIELLDTEIVDIIMSSSIFDVPTIDGDSAGNSGTLTPGGFDTTIFD